MKKIIFCAVTIGVIVLGLCLRFYNAPHINSWDQQRDVYVMTQFLKGHLPIAGPRTGVGHMSLAPLYFYILAPFYFVFGHNGEQAFNMFFNLVTLGGIFYISKLLFNRWVALSVLILYVINPYLIHQNQIPWNVTLVPLSVFVIYYSACRLTKTLQLRWSILLWTMCGVFFSIHFTAVMFPVFIVLVFIMNLSKRLFLLLMEGLPFWMICLIPLIFAPHQSQTASEFLKVNFVGIHLKFILYRLPDSLFLFKALLYNLPYIEYILPVICLFLAIRSKYKLHARIITAWLIANLVVFGVYGGPISDYYFLPTLPVVYFSLVIMSLYLLSHVKACRNRR